MPAGGLPRAITSMPTPPTRDGGPREVAIDERLVEADRFEDLRAAIALQRRDAHLGHHLEDALVERLDVVRDGRARA